jgi:hypothetical protein
VTGAAFEESFHQVVLDDDKPDVAGMVPGLIAFRPHVVIDEFDTEGSVDALRSIEKAWAHGAAPSYVVVDPTNDGLAHLVASAPELRKRVFSVESPANTANLRYALHYNEVYGTKGSARGALSTPYDAFYLLAYAAAAAEDPREGTSLARAIPLLGGPGKTIEVGETGIFDALNALHAGQHVSLVGTAGVLAFDPETGNRTADFAVTCFHAGADRAYEVESGMVYRATSGKLEGSLRCP